MKRPNILILYTDQQRWDALGANGNPHIKTPNLDRLASEGVNFDHYFVQNPVCMPSRISFLSGKYPSTIGITHMGVPVPEQMDTLPKMIKNYGYLSANIGKLHFLPHANRDHRTIHPSYGFDHLEISDEPGPYEDAYRAWVRKKASDQLSAISLGLPPAAQTWQQTMGVTDGIDHPRRDLKEAIAFGGRSDVTHTAYVAEQTMEFIESHQNESWLCIAGFYSPHEPWVAPQEFLNLYDPAALPVPNYPPHLESRRIAEGRCSDAELRSVKHGYYAMVSEVDHHVGNILKRLESLNLTDNTIVIFTSDHGEWLGEHLRYAKGYPGEDSISRVPFIVRWPNGIRNPGRVFTGLTEAVDMIPTVLECAGIPVPTDLQGTSMKPVLDGEEDVDGKACVMMEFTGWRNIRTKRYRYLCEASGAESLYDLEVDPWQYDNVSNQIEYADIMSEMRGMLAQRMIQIQQPLLRTWSY